MPCDVCANCWREAQVQAEASWQLLPQRSFKGLLSIADFPGAVSEGPILESLSPFEKGNAHTENYTTTCEYIPPERFQADPEPKGGGSDILTVYGHQFYQHTKLKTVPCMSLTR